MKFRVSKKALVITIPVVLVVAGAVSYFLFIKKSNTTEPTSAPTVQIKTEEKTDDVFSYLDGSTDFARFSQLMDGASIKEKIAPTATGTPQLIIFAVKESAFSKDDIGDFSPTGADERILYHFAVVTAAADGTKPSLDLTDGQKITTLAGRDILVKKVGTKTTLIDTKGRVATVSSPYISDAAGNRIYPIDNVLLLQ